MKSKVGSRQENKGKIPIFYKKSRSKRYRACSDVVQATGLYGTSD